MPLCVERRGGLPARLTARFTRLRFVDVEGTPPKRRALEPLNGGLCRTGVRHLHETKPTGLAGVAVGNDIDRVHNTIRLEELADVLIRRAERKIANKNIHARVLVRESRETIARSSEQYAEATNARARCRRNGERTSKPQARAYGFIGWILYNSTK